MWLNWLPWRYIVGHVARARGFVDPVSVLAQLHRFAQPSEVAAPLELLRAGVLFHARGLMNTGAIQHNLDWVWPYWVERQFDPHDDAFIPRAFSITHVNLTHRNWTAVGLPDCDWLPLVDPRGLLTPYWDSWSIDGWVITDDGRELLPSQAPAASQCLELCDQSGVAVLTESARDRLSLHSRVSMEAVQISGQASSAICRQQLVAKANAPGWLVVSLRPSNPEGVHFVHELGLTPDELAWSIEGVRAVEFGSRVERHRASKYRKGDVRTWLLDGAEQRHMVCDVGMATAAAMFRLEPDLPREITVSIPFNAALEQAPETTKHHVFPSWPQALRGHCQLQIPDRQFQFLYDAALRTLVLHSPADVYPGPYTYKRFWYRDAAFILHAMLCAGLTDRVRRSLDRFPLRQTHGGYYRSQEGEWDANGEALWILKRYLDLTGIETPVAWRQSITRGAKWIVHKRLPDHLAAVHAGLLPSGFSAEHLGPNDFYYWDDFWGVAGLQAGADLVESWGENQLAASLRAEAQRFMQAIERSLAATQSTRTRGGIPASPYRRMDAGAIGSLAVGYPLQLWPADDRRLLDTVDFLVQECFYKGGFFQDMIHSGINAYLTLHVAQVQLRAGNPSFMERMRAVAALASPTGQWPEAIHPRTLGGCMGDGQHVWAAAEWMLLVRNCFVREEGNRLILASGIPDDWLLSGQTLSFGPAPTPHGDISIEIECGEDFTRVAWRANWRGAAPEIEIRLLENPPVTVERGVNEFRLERPAMAAGGKLGATPGQ